MVAQQMGISDVIKMIFGIFEKELPFNELLGFKVEPWVEGKPVTIRLEMKPELVGNYALQILHGGVISSVLDTVGGLTAAVGMLKEMTTFDAVEIEKRLIKYGKAKLFPQIFNLQSSILNSGLSGLGLSKSGFVLQLWKHTREGGLQTRKIGITC